MNRILKNAAAFFFAATLIALWYPQLETTVSAADLTEISAKVEFNTSDTDEKANSSKANSSTNAAKSNAAPATNKAASAAGSSYTATAYALRGKTANGSGVRRGIIAADPRVLPLGTRVQITAGQWTGTYVVADTGGAIKGRKIDVWVPSNAEARKFGRRKITLTVLGR